MDLDRWRPQLEAEVRRVGALQLQGAKSLRSEDIQMKCNAAGERSVVTEHDVESERQFRDFLRREFPDHSFLGEETGNDVRDPEHYWIVDPIDGTTNFANGIPYWGPSLAYWHRGQPTLAVVYFPQFDSLFTAQRGCGAQHNGEPIHTSDAREYSSLTTVALHSRTHYTHRLRLRAKVRVLGSIIGNMCYTAQGTFAAAHGRGRLWDLAAGVLILEEAGALVETRPDHMKIDVAEYARNGDAGEVMTLFARANHHLPPLSRFLERDADAE
jgi:myo-inositol-1(or 4)-monophosphatase